MRSILSLTVALTFVVQLTVSQRYPVSAEDNAYLSELYAEYEAAAAAAARPTPRSYSPEPPVRQQPAGPKPTPVAILKQINRHNEDGSYTYGFEGADGSFKIETKSPTGEVKGKYGFVDAEGKVRVVEYGADKYGFQPSGEGITVAPPTLVDETTSKEAIAAQNYQDYQDYQQAQVTPKPRLQLVARTQTAAAPQQPAYQPQYHTQHRHTQALFAPQARPTALPLQSQLIQQAYYDEEQPQPQAQHQQALAYRTGPVQFAPAPVHEPRQPVQQPRAGPAAQAGSGGLLDQLARDYALPSNAAAPLHDITFGYY